MEKIKVVKFEVSILRRHWSVWENNTEVCIISVKI
jgi:hypothetical protein